MRSPGHELRYRVRNSLPVMAVLAELLALLHLGQDPHRSIGQYVPRAQEETALDGRCRLHASAPERLGVPLRFVAHALHVVLVSPCDLLAPVPATRDGVGGQSLSHLDAVHLENLHCGSRYRSGGNFSHPDGCHFPVARPLAPKGPRHLADTACVRHRRDHFRRTADHRCEQAVSSFLSRQDLSVLNLTGLVHHVALQDHLVADYQERHRLNDYRSQTNECCGHQTDFSTPSPSNCADLLALRSMDDRFFRRDHRSSRPLQLGANRWNDRHSNAVALYGHHQKQGGQMNFGEVAVQAPGRGYGRNSAAPQKSA